MTSRALGLFVAALLVLAPELAHACAVCGAGADEDQSSRAYALTSLVLSLLPFVMLGGFLLWLRIQGRKQGQGKGAALRASRLS